MAIYSRQELVRSELPITNGRLLDIINATGPKILLATVYADGFLIYGTITFMIEDKNMLSGGAWYLTEERIGGAFYLTGEVFFRGSSVFVGVFSWQRNKKGYIWGTDLGRCTAL